MTKLLNYLPFLILVFGFVSITTGVFLYSINLGFIILGILLIVLAYLVIPKGGD